MLRGIFDKDGPSLVGMVLSLIVMVSIIIAMGFLIGR
jgi:hypothetical protein